MGLITKLVESEIELTIFAVNDEVEAEQVLKEIILFLTGTPTQLVLWDIRQGTLERISPSDLRMIVERASPFAERRKGGRTAIVCTTDLNFGLSRMFQIFAELMQIPFEIHVARNIEDAKKWLYTVKRT
jgi:hypothetical protein